MTTPEQTRTLWSAALHSLADAIGSGLVQNLPTSIDVWTQHVTPQELISLSCSSDGGPYKIKLYETFAQVTIPVGKLLDLDMTWKIHAERSAGDEDIIANYAWHNENCCNRDNDVQGDPALHNDRKAP